ncbi:ABC transporter ATP-binding protein [Limobrevibacterium gyesilva]|uniref:ABC transporter ATP-binding protein n=1 Tax=Limobrevibacterium gyesilva TaxID=2991712 RepID=A0AA41YMS8_9PROT|nr:ABC transporter ATP-binding protein [Limobrevibacterium gyesilva]MCW3476774.1 ABC transporter ATP-binding protein [Limobrevibacterium gyesilva]
MAEPILSVRNLQTQFAAQEGVVHAVDGVDFDVFEGRTLGVVGESGCGKSVTARSILGIVESPGRVVGGQILLRPAKGGAPIDLLTLSPKAMRDIRGPEIALVFQEPMASFSQYYTIGNQITEAIRLHMGMDANAARARAIDLLDMVGVPQPSRRVDEYPFQLSGGLRQRVMIAMALACDPRVLIADEPTTALDVTTQAQILDLLRELQQKRGLAIILITHDMGVIAEMAHDVAVMYLGRAVETGPVGEIFSSPKHPYTRALLRSIPTVLAKPRTRLPTIAGSIPHPFNRPTGCPYHPRCSEIITGLCETAEPPAVGEASREVRCFLHGGRP